MGREVVFKFSVRFALERHHVTLKDSYYYHATQNLMLIIVYYTDHFRKNFENHFVCNPPLWFQLDVGSARKVKIYETWSYRYNIQIHQFFYYNTLRFKTHHKGWLLETASFGRLFDIWTTFEWSNNNEWLLDKLWNKLKARNNFWCSSTIRKWWKIEVP